MRQLAIQIFLTILIFTTIGYKIGYDVGYNHNRLGEVEQISDIDTTQELPPIEVYEHQLNSSTNVSADYSVYLNGVIAFNFTSFIIDKTIAVQNVRLINFSAFTVLEYSNITENDLYEMALLHAQNMYITNIWKHYGDKYFSFSQTNDINPIWRITIVEQNEALVWEFDALTGFACNFYAWGYYGEFSIKANKMFFLNNEVQP